MKSTEARPLAFFKSILAEGGLENERNNFFKITQLTEQPSYFIYNIDRENWTYEIEYEVTTKYEVDDSIEGYPQYIENKKEWVRVEKSFKDELTKKLDREFETSKSLISKKINAAGTKDVARYIAENIFEYIEKLRIEASKDVSEIHTEIKHKLDLIIEYLYDTYEKICPKKSDAIIQILSDLSGIKPPIKQELGSKFFNYILTVCDKNGNLLLDNIDRAKANFKLLLGGNISEIENEINFKWAKYPTFYLLYRIKEYDNESIIFSDLLKSGKVKFCNKFVTEDAFYKGISIFKNERYKNHYMKLLIDERIESFLVTIS